MESIAELIRIEADAMLRKPFILNEKIKIYPLTVGQMIDVNPLLISLQEEDEFEKIEKVANEDDFNEALKIIDKYLPIMIKVIEIIVGKNKCNDMTPDDILITFIAIVKRIQTRSFLSSIIQMTRMSLNEKEGIIASRKYIIGHD